MSLFRLSFPARLCYNPVTIVPLLSGSRVCRVAKRSGPINPFYIVLVVAGMVFAITACAYGVMTFLAMQSSYGENKPALLDFLEEHGAGLLSIELAVLAVATFAAMGTDSYWDRRAERKAAAESSTPSPPPTSRHQV